MPPSAILTVIPEIDIPGHCMAVLAVHPEFSTTPDEPKSCAKTWGIFNKFNNVLAPRPEVFAFLKDVFSELCDIFPGSISMSVVMNAPNAGGRNRKIHRSLCVITA